MDHDPDAALSQLFCSEMPVADRQILLELGELLARTNGRYRQEIGSTIRMIGLAVESESPRDCDGGSHDSGRVIPFKRRTG